MSELLPSQGTQLKCLDNRQAHCVPTAGIDLAAQPAKTGAVLVDWSSEPHTVGRPRRRRDASFYALDSK